MQALRFLHKFVTNALPEVHKVRREALISATSSLVEHGQLTLTALGRNMRGEALVKHKIKKWTGYWAIASFFMKDFIFTRKYQIACLRI